MRLFRLVFLLFFLLINTFCWGQSDNLRLLDSMSVSNVNKRQTDSLMSSSRRNAAKVLKKLKLSDERVLLFSIGSYYYVIAETSNGDRKEYFCNLRTFSNVQYREVPFADRRKDYETYLLKAEPIFAERHYPSGPVTLSQLPGFICASGVPSYFVIYRADGSRYGEFFLPAISLESCIDVDLYIYLNRRLRAEEMKWDKD